MTPKQILAKNTGYSFACPNCGAVEKLCIHVTAFADVSQLPLEGTFGTTFDGRPPDFYSSDFMSCGTCKCIRKVSDFDLRD